MGEYNRGMSPLIATVLLMAFAVALGGMIMNWSIDSGTKSADCELIKVHILQMCSNNDKIKLNLRNDADSVNLQGIKLDIIESSVESTLSIRGSNLAPGQPLDISIPAATSPSTKVDVLGVVGSAENPVTCTTPLESANPIVAC